MIKTTKKELKQLVLEALLEYHIEVEERPEIERAKKIVEIIQRKLNDPTEENIRSAYVYASMGLVKLLALAQHNIEDILGPGERN